LVLRWACDAHCVAIVLVAGEFIGFQMGLSFAAFFDPLQALIPAVISRLLNLVTMLVFLAANGHLVMLKAFYIPLRLFPYSPAVCTPMGGV